MAMEIHPRTAGAGFSWGGVLAALLVLGVLMIVIAPLTQNMDRNGRQMDTKSTMRAIVHALEAFRADNGHYPSTEQGLQALVERPAGEPVARHWQGYLKELPKDGWGRPWHYAAAGTTDGFDLRSYGSDSKPGGEEHAKDVVHSARGKE